MCQFTNTLKRISKNPHVSLPRGVTKHLFWQIRKTLNLFPFDLKFSNSVLNASSKKCSVSALVNCMELYDYNNMKFISEILRNHGGVFIDVGANVGSYTLLASESALSKVISVEAHPQTFKELQLNIKKNNRPNVETLQFAISNFDGEIKLSNETLSSTNSVLTQRQNSDTISVQCRKLDTLNTQWNDLAKNSPWLLKIDVEGHEFEVLSGACNLLLRQVDVLFVEISHNRDACIRLLNDLQFTGPWTVDFNQRKILPSRSRQTEDELFLKSTTTVLKMLGWS